MKTPNDPRHLARKVAFSVIYSIETANNSQYTGDYDELINSVLENYEITDYDHKVFENILNSTTKNLPEIKNLIASHSTGWNMDKIYKTDLALLIMATAEMMTKTVPLKVSIDESIELAKEFCQEESSKFINGVLAGIIKELNDGSKPDQQN